jgi:hypothetical protein
MRADTASKDGKSVPDEERSFSKDREFASEVDARAIMNPGGYRKD